MTRAAGRLLSRTLSRQCKLCPHQNIISGRHPIIANYSTKIVPQDENTKSAQKPILFREEMLKEKIYINPVYRSWLKSPEIRKKELMRRRESHRQEFELMDRSELEETLLDKYKKLYLEPEELSLTEMLMHRPIPDHLACSEYDPLVKKRISNNYTQINYHSNYVAHFLRLKGLKKGDAVGVMLNEEDNLTTIMMACLRGGFVYVPLDAKGMTTAQLDFRIRDANCKWIISHIDHHETAQVLQEGLPDVQLLNFSDFGTDTPRDVRDYAVEGKEYFLQEDIYLPFVEHPRFAGSTKTDSGVDRPLSEMDTKVSPDDIMCLLYTMDAQGNQKGFPVPYRALAAIHAYMEVARFVEEEERSWSAVSPHSPQGVLYTIIGHLVLGSEAVYLNGPARGSFYMAGLRALEVESIVATQTFLEELMKAADAKNASFLKTQTLRKVSYTGSRMNPALIEPFERLWNVKFYNHYGTAEDGMIINDAHLPVFESLSKEHGSLGRPQIGYRVVLLNENKEEVSGIDQVGEIAVDVDASPLYWFTGYHNNEDATQQKFVNSPSSGKRYALTGDIAKRIDDQDHFSFVGRRAAVVVNMGRKVDVDHVESVLRTHPGIHDALIIQAPQHSGKNVLISFAIRQDTGVKPSKQDLKLETELILEWVREKAPLEEYEQVNQFVFVDRFPEGDTREARREILRQGLGQK